MNAVLKSSGILIIGLAAVACAERSITDAPQAKDSRSIAASFAVLPGAQVAINFEPLSAGAWYLPGSIHLQDDWSSSGPYDHKVAVNALSALYDYPTFGLQSLRISNAVTSGSFGDHTFSKRLQNAAGESDANGGGFALTSGTPTKNFAAQWDFASTVPGAEQPGLSVVASPDRGDGARMSWVQMTDTPNGLDINFFDVQGEDNPANFVGPTNVASGLDRRVPHTIKITMHFIDGPSNDVVKVYVDGRLEHTGTSWENYFRFDSEAAAHGGKPPIVNRILFRTGGTAAPLTAGNGFVIDDFSMRSRGGPGNASECKNGGWQDFDEFKNQGDCVSSVNKGN